MYRSIAICIISIFCISASGVDSRVERWNLRIERLKKLQAEADAGKTDSRLIYDLAANEIKSSEEFLELLARYKKEDGSLKSETKKFTVAEIEKKVKDASLPAISLCYLSELFRLATDPGLKQSIGGDISSYIQKKYSGVIKPAPAESAVMAMEYVFEKGIGEYESFYDSIKSDILSKTEYELSRRDYNTNNDDIIKLIIKHTEAAISEKKLSEKIIFDEKHLASVPGWKFIEDRCLKNSERNKSVMNFIHAKGGDQAIKETGWDMTSAANGIFTKEKEKISDLLSKTTPSSGATGNNPLYEIPDMKKLISAIDEIDKYRKNLINNIHGSEDTELIKKLVNNNSGIAARHISRFEALYKTEEARIERLKKIKGNIIVYNEEVFRLSRKHFYDVSEEIYKYAALSGDFIDALCRSGKSDPAQYISLHRYRCERYIKYISFADKLTADMSGLPENCTQKLQSHYRGTIPKVLHIVKTFLKPESIPGGIRESMSREMVREFASINTDFRTTGTLLVSTIRKNYDGTIAGFLRISSLKKEADLDSEGKIGQNEVDRLFAFAAKCSGIISSMKYTQTWLSKYRDEYNRITQGLNKGTIKNGPGAVESLFPVIGGFNTDKIEIETATREILAREGMEALSGAVSIVQYYKRKGAVIKLVPADTEIKSMKRIFTETPEVTVSTWRMNGKNFRKIDENIIAELKKIQNKNAWNKSAENNPSESIVIKNSGLNITFTAPAGWKKLPTGDISGSQVVKYESPDMRGLIELTAFTGGDLNIQTLAGSWPEKSGFSMIKKMPGKKSGIEYMQSTAKNRYDQVMESYIIENKAHVIIISGRTTGELYRHLNRTLAELFKNMVITGS
jgi:hypothetical protein